MIRSAAYDPMLAPSQRSVLGIASGFATLRNRVNVCTDPPEQEHDHQSEHIERREHADLPIVR